MDNSFEDYVCTSCIRKLDLQPIFKSRNYNNYITACDVCNQPNRCCFLLERSTYSNDNDSTRYNEGIKERLPQMHLFYFNRKSANPELSKSHRLQMWKDGVEYNMGLSLCLIHIRLNEDGLYVPIEIIKLIYSIAKRISKKYAITFDI